jgi:poly-gamma-glutamate synthesis protein (capsule biosynthesis protein)
MGFRILLTANNHALDRHQLGIDRTIEAIKRAGLAFTGTRSRDDMSAPWYAITPVTAAGGTFRIAWLGATYGTNGIPDKAHQVLHCYDQREEVLELIRTLAKRPDLNAVIFTPHWGIEYQTKPDARQIALAHDAIDAGATAVIGTHPHVVQPLEKYTTKDGREALIAYSLGNFISNQIGLPRLSEPLLLLGLTPGEHGKLQVARVGWIPLHMRTHGGFRVEAIDRTVGEGRESRAYLLRHLPEGNLHPPTASYAARFAAATCPSPT